MKTKNEGYEINALDDKEKIQAINNFQGCKDNVIINYFRLGQKSDESSRPIKVTFQSVSKAQKVLTGSTKSKTENLCEA